MKWYWLTALVLAAIIAASIGLFEIPDAFFYATLGKWLYTGHVVPISPFNTSLPPLLFAPVYALLTTPLLWMPYPNFTIPFIQLLLVFGSGHLLYRVAATVLPPPWAKVCVLLFFCQPFVLPYATFFMSETVALFGVGLYLWLLWSVYERRWPPSLLVLCSSLLVLTRYAFIPLLGISLVLWLSHFRRPLKAQAPAIVGLIFLLLWVGVNHQLYGVFTISTFTGRHLYNSVVTQAHLLPTPSAPDSAKFFRYVPTTPSIVYQPWWLVQPYFAPAFGQKLLSEVDIDRLFLRVSLAAIRQHPRAFFLHLFTMPVRNLTTAPYHDHIVQFTNSSAACRFGWEKTLCHPLWGNPALTQLWGSVITSQAAFYPWGAVILAVVAVLGLVTALVGPRLWLRVAAIAFLVQFGFQSGSEWVEGRFIIPLYSFYTLFLVMGLVASARLVQIPPHGHQIQSSLPHQRPSRK